MKAEMGWQLDIRQGGAHQFIFIIGNRQQYFILYWFSVSAGPLACLYDSKVFATHANFN
jgi:hypothetical protein